MLFKIGLGSRVQMDVMPAFARIAGDHGTQSGIGDLVLAVKWRLVDQNPILGAFAAQPSVLLPTGSVERGTGDGHAGVGVLAISSRTLGDVAIDVNLGYVHMGGDGTKTPTDNGLWCVSSGFPIAGPVGAVAELFGELGTGGPAGEKPSIGFLVGPTLQASPSLVFDAGLILNVSGLGDTTVYAGLTWNVGRAWGRASRPQRITPIRTWQ